MRQAGILAACGIVSLTKMVDRLAEDHERARRTALALSSIPGLKVEMDTVQTNMVLVHTDQPAVEWQDWLGQEGVWCFPVAANRLRLVFHGDVDDAMTDRAIEAFRTVSNKHVAAFAS
jgi:threonine aldolase